ncbi:MAG: DUF4118 domain-containing protein [Myxococcales bacterium]|nr:DUF4118 domain-containing protein [Myxococcales bacterium]
MPHRAPIGPTGPRLLLGAAALIALISLGHYATDTHNVAIHNVYRRLYYLPVVLAAFGGGWLGGVAAAVVASLAYIPHAFLMSHHHRDPAPTLDKVLEIGLLVAVGGLTGWLVHRERGARQRLQAALDERAALEQQLVRAGKLGALGELLAGVAHEIRNPLASIQGAAEALERHVPAGDRAHRYVELQLREGARLQRVVSDFLAFARMRPAEPTVLPLADVVQQVIGLAKHQGGAGEYAVHPSLADARLTGDRDQVVQVLLNLTLNAVQAAAGEPVRVTYLAEQRAVGGVPHRCVGVRDTGPGIDPAHLEQVFDPFFTTRDDGVGLGLSLSSRLAQAHGGFLDVQSQPGETTFWLCLPTEAP